jgi:hypothetical protein
VAQQEDFGGRSRLIELRGLVREDLAGKSVFARDLKGVSALLLRWVEGEGEDGLSWRGGLGREWQERDVVSESERVGIGVKDRDIVFGVRGDDLDRKEDRGPIAAGDQDVRLAAIVKGFEDMGGGQEITVFVDEEAVTEEAVVIAARRWRLVQLINDGADGRG